MFNDHVKKYLEGITGEIIKSKILRLFGIGESLMAQKLNNLIQNSKNPTVAPYAKDNDVTLRITAKGNSEKECDDLINPVDKEIKDALGEYIYGEGETSLENVVSEILCNNKLSVSTAESCTGGMIAASLISYPGISDVFKEGAVTYSNESKMKRLGVSEETAREMAIGIAREANTDISISTTGIAGPGGGTDEKPVGLVYIGVFIKGKVVVNKFNFTGNRERIRRKTTMNALNILRKELLKI